MHLAPLGKNLPTWVKYPCLMLGANIFALRDILPPRGFFRHINTILNLPILVNFIYMFEMTEIR